MAKSDIFPLQYLCVYVTVWSSYSLKLTDLSPTTLNRLQLLNTIIAPFDHCTITKPSPILNIYCQDHKKMPDFRELGHTYTTCPTHHIQYTYDGLLW